MSAAEHSILLALLTGILLSIPVALGAFRWVFPLGRRVANPEAAGTSRQTSAALDAAAVSSPETAESGVPCRHWRAVDGIAALVLVGTLTFLMGPLVVNPDATAGLTLTPELLAQQLAFQLSMATLLLFYLAIVRGLDLVSIFGLHRLSLRQLAIRGFRWFLCIVAATIAAGMVSAPLVKWLTGDPEPNQQLIVQALETRPDSTLTTLTFLSVCVGAPLMEELVFRGFLYSVAKRFTDLTYAVAGSSLFFAITHANLLTFVPLTVLGVLFAVAYERTRSLAVPVLLHATFNLIQTCYLLYGQDSSPG